MNSPRPLQFIEVEQVSKNFQKVKALDQITLSVKRNETLGIVGESGSGKSTFGKLLMRLFLPSSGKISVEGEDLSHFAKNRMLEFRQKIQMVFQDPYGSLDPLMTVEEILKEPLEIHSISKNKRDAWINQLLNYCGLSSKIKKRYPREFSGGQRQRISIARALAVKPSCIICDEPVSALDVSIQAQILNLLKDLQKELGLTYLFISHDLKVIHYMADRIAVFKSGRLLELESRSSLFENPKHPYTKELLSHSYLSIRPRV